MFELYRNNAVNVHGRVLILRLAERTEESVKEELGLFIRGRGSPHQMFALKQLVDKYRKGVVCM